MQDLKSPENLSDYAVFSEDDNDSSNDNNANPSEWPQQPLVKDKGWLGHLQGPWGGSPVGPAPPPVRPCICCGGTHLLQRT
ncbi:hypothetical protein XENTR_v10011360 [Xenopus tropicalis]|nr:hypothetical protein XENTR_v10011360 [Xenopus tropicalis]